MTVMSRLCTFRSMDLEPITLREYITNANVSADSNLPWVHSTASARLFAILRSGRLLATPCNVFTGEKLCYLFVGRAAYKSPEALNPAPWQLPVVFVIRFHERPPIKRVFPFDSGAFVSERLPRYITMFKLPGYEVGNDPANIGRLISFFFKTPERYMKRRGADAQELQEEHNMTMRHQEIMALMKLYQEGSTPDFDDRAATIELQLEQDIQLARENLIGLVVPNEYLRTPGVKQAVESLTPNIEGYDHFPLSQNQHYGLIYDAVQRIYRAAGVRI